MTLPQHGWRQNYKNQTDLVLNRAQTFSVYLPGAYLSKLLYIEKLSIRYLYLSSEDPLKATALKLLVFLFLADPCVFAANRDFHSIQQEAKKIVDDEVSGKIRNRKLLMTAAGVGGAAITAAGIYYSSKSKKNSRVKGFPTEEEVKRFMERSSKPTKYSEPMWVKSLPVACTTIWSLCPPWHTADIKGVFSNSKDFDPGYEYSIAKEMARISLAEDFISKETYDYIMRNLTQINLLISSESACSTDHTVDIRSALSGILAIFKLPNDCKVLKPSKTIKDGLDNLLQQYSEELRDDLEAKVLEIISDSKLNKHEANGHLPRKKTLYFRGDDRAEIADTALNLGEILDLPLAHIKLSEIKDPNLVFGIENEQSLDFPLEHFNKKSIFTNAMLNAKDQKGDAYANIIVIIEDADKLLNVPEANKRGMEQLLWSMLRLLDPNQPKMFLNDLQFNVDVSNCIFILTGKENIEEEAIRDRISTYNLFY